MATKVITRLLAAGVGVVLLGSLVACGDGGGNDGVASLSNGETASADDSGSGGGDNAGADRQQFEDAMLEFAKCMRENGVDMPDPTFDGTGKGGAVISRRAPSGGDSDSGGGNVVANVGGKSFNADDATFKKANEACEPIMEEAQKYAPKPSPEEQAEMQDRMLDYAKCMREHGIDMPDPTFESDGGGRTKVQIGGAGDGGIKPDSQEFQDANEACAPEGGPGKGGFMMAPGASVDSGDSGDKG